MQDREKRRLRYGKHGHGFGQPVERNVGATAIERDEVDLVFDEQFVEGMSEPLAHPLSFAPTGRLKARAKAMSWDCLRFILAKLRAKRLPRTPGARPGAAGPSYCGRPRVNWN